MTNKEVQALITSALTDLRKTKEGYVTHPDGPNWVRAMDKLNRAKKGLNPPPNRVPALGPVIQGGKSVLLHDCTHITDGIGWPAFDDMADPGTAVLAPEPIMIYDNTSGAQGGDAFYGRGASGMRYWFGHITTVPRQGAVFKKGEILTRVSSHHPAPHCHLGIDAKPLIGHALISHTDYTHGAPLIGVQLNRVLNT